MDQIVIQGANERDAPDGPPSIDNNTPCNHGSDHSLNSTGNVQAGPGSESSESCPNLSQKSGKPLSLSNPNPVSSAPVHGVQHIDSLSSAADPSNNPASMELEFFSAQREHPPFVCPKPICNTCKDSKGNAKCGADTFQCYKTNGNNSSRNFTGPGPSNTDSVAPTRTVPDSNLKQSELDPDGSNKANAQNNAQSFYSRALGYDYVTYPGSSPPIKDEPEGIAIVPCMPQQKAAWWIRAHDFSNPCSLPDNDIQESCNFDFSKIVGPSFGILLLFFYLIVGTNVASMLSQVLLLFIAGLHLCSLCLMDTDTLYYSYHDGFTQCFTFFGSYLEILFDALAKVNCTVFYVFSKMSPPYCTKLYVVLMQKMEKFWPKLLYQPTKTLSNYFTYIMTNLLKIIYLAGFYYPKLSSSVSTLQIHHLNFQGIPTNKTKNIFPSPISQGIPIFFENGLPYVSATVNGTMVKFLVDTGSAHNIINKSIVDKLTRNCVDIPRFSHNLKLHGHSGQPLAIDPYAVKIPVKFLDHDSLLSSKKVELPFLVENNESAVSILGMSSLRKLNISSSKGFRHLFLTLNEDPPPVGSPSPGHPYKGTVSPSCNASQVPYLDIRFPDLTSYTGCVILSNTHQNHHNSLDINGKIYHITRGKATFKSPLPVWSASLKDFSLSGAPISCSHSDPEDEEALASLLNSPADDPDLAAERRRDLEQDSLLFDNVLKNHIHTVDPDPNPNPILSPSYDWENLNNFDVNITVPGKPISEVEINHNIADPDPNPDPPQAPMHELESHNLLDSNTSISRSRDPNPDFPEYLRDPGP